MRSTGHPGHQGNTAAGRIPDGHISNGHISDGHTSDGHTSDGRTSDGLLTKAVCVTIGVYQAISATRPPHCRYWPTCSAYALEAVEAHGVGRGLWLAGRRLLRCRPWGGSGVDLVPSDTRRRRIAA